MINLLNFPAALIVAQHLDPQSDASLKTDVANQNVALPLKLAQAEERLQAGMVYIALLRKHLLINPDGTFGLSQAVFVDFTRPSADLLLQSVAASFKERSLAVILSGTGSDVALGVQAIHKMGGKVIVQDQSTCEFLEMPEAAMPTGKVDFVLSPGAIASRLVDLVTELAK